MDHTNSPDTFRCNSTNQCDAFQSLNLARNVERKTRQKKSNESDIAVSFTAPGNAVTCSVIRELFPKWSNKYLITKLISFLRFPLIAFVFAF